MGQGSNSRANEVSQRSRVLWTGRVIRYDMKKKEATVVMDKLFLFLVIVMDKLHLPNGLDRLYSHVKVLQILSIEYGSRIQ